MKKPPEEPSVRQTGAQSKAATLRHIESHLSMALNLAMGEDLPETSHYTKLALNSIRMEVAKVLGAVS